MKLRWLPLLAVLFCTPALPYPAPYTCTRNFYVATTGVDNASCGSSASPCATMQGADNNISLIGGDCVNVAAGTYNITGQINLSKGGNLNQANGYVTYIGAPNHGSVMKATNSMGYELSFGSSYLIIDGFEFNGNNIVGDYVVGSNGNNQHHLMVLNNLVHNSSGGGGVGFAQSDYYIIAGNIVYNNPSSWESGISVYEPKQVSGFNSSLAWDTQIYHIQILQNISHNNGIYAQPQHTDGNGITADDWRNTQTTGIEYPYQGLIQSNVAYGNGGQCVQAMSDNNLTIENNTCYNNMLDAQNTAAWRGEITVGFTHNTIVKNNALYAVPGGGTTAANVGLVFAGTPGGSNVFSNNLTFNSSNGTNSGYCTTSINVTNTSNDSANCAAMLANNKVNTNPQWTNLSTPDFHPLSGSPLLGAGAAPPAGYLPFTIEGFAQPSPPNIGAFNHAGSPPPPSVQGPVSIHAGGSAIGTFVADAGFSGGSQTSNWTGAVDTSLVTNPAPQAVYQTERYGTFSYMVSGLMASKSYKVNLHFTEDFETAAGRRLENVSINGTQVLSNFDIFAATGAQHKAIVKTFTANADTSGNIVISFAAASGSPDTSAKVDGVEVLTPGSPPPPPPSGQVEDFQYLVGDWYLPDLVLPAAGTTGVPGASTIRCVPAGLRNKATIDNVGTRVHTADSARHLQFAIYTNGTNLRPANLVSTSTSMSLATAGVISSALSSKVQGGPGGANFTDTFWFCSNTDSTKATFSSVNTTTAFGQSIIGASTAGNVLQASGSGVVISHLSCSGSACNGGSSTYGTWPSSLAGTTWTEQTTIKMPMMAIQFVSVP